MKIGIVGGRLQGTEVTYLSKMAGYETFVIDKDRNSPAFGLADHEIVMDLLDEEEKGRFEKLISQLDVVIPAMENKQVLSMVKAVGESRKVPVLFHEKAYELSSSKGKSNALFQRLKLAVPKTYPHSSGPFIVKPDGESGSKGVIKAQTAAEVDDLLKSLPPDTVIQEYLEGRSFSLEVMGDGQHYCFSQITEVIVDKHYDCKRIAAPAEISQGEREQMLYMANQLAEAIKIQGIFDIEVISQGGQLKLLEIDARFPSQTPISIYHSCHLNLVERMVSMVVPENTPSMEPPVSDPCLSHGKIPDTCLYQQIQVTPQSIQVLGEHIMENCGKLHIEHDFFGAYQAITDYSQRKAKTDQTFQAIVITLGRDQKEAYGQFQRCMENMQKAFGIPIFVEG